MRILYIQETDWLEKGPQQQHHILERLSNKGHKIVVLDYEIDWREKKPYKFFTKKLNKKIGGKACNSSNIYLIRPLAIRIPLFNYISIFFTYSVKILHLIKSFKPNIIMGGGILTISIACFLSNKSNIPFVYNVVDKDYRLIPFKPLIPLGFAIESWIGIKAQKTIDGLFFHFFILIISTTNPTEGILMMHLAIFPSSSLRNLK